MATKKTTSASGTTTTGKTGAGRPKKPSAKPTAKPRAKPAAKPAAAKSDPVILDPPKKPAAEPAKKTPDVVDAKVVETTKPETNEKPAEKPAETEKVAKAVEKTAQNPRRSSGFIGLVGGGVIAAGIGYLAAGYINPPPPVVDNSAEIAALTTDYTAQLATLEGRIAELENSPVAQLEKDVTALKTTLAEQSAQLSERVQGTETKLEQALAELEASRSRLAEYLGEAGGEISAASAALIAQYGADIDALKAQVAEQIADRDALSQRLEVVAEKASEQLASARAKVEELSETALNSAKDVDLTLARERLDAAIETGKSYGSVLGDIAREAAIDIPKALSEGADQGIDTLTDLQKSFPEAARRALKSSIKAEAGDGLTDKLGAFLKAQIGARSLEEKEGDDPDAVLSRAEAALSRGELQGAVDLVRKLPAEGIAELSDWLAAAEARLRVEAALEELSNALDGANQE